LRLMRTRGGQPQTALFALTEHRWVVAPLQPGSILEVSH